ncbi:serine/threonine-protein kinase [Streptomyces sp. RKCA744]|uniref:serine/threonine-protein kinase n=1 Tax=Streptomyces sp. RKCA744 TaxID=2959340 RepID=UPI00209E2821|nr:serine/threonine-protein kinase [Streptomyces sp. RKCA744]MCO8302915.1 serine/threonine protein kinase [Streptomyces sp. RKCA744]
MKPLETDTDPRVVGPFELLARLGQGGMGLAYLARWIPQDGLDAEQAAAYHVVEPDGGSGTPQSRLVVVKRIQPQLLDAAQARQRFAREIDSIAAVVSDRVPALRGAAPEAAEPWFAMDYVAGPSLHTMVKESGTFPVGPCAALGLALVDALRAIHGTGLLHRDLKPANVVLGPDGPMVLDFGLATLIEKRTSQAITGPGEAWGTWPYASYEQLHHFQDAKEPADVYSLGATLFFALTGRPPYPDHALPTPPSWNGVPPEFRPLLGQILVQAPSHRPDLEGLELGLYDLLAQADLTADIAVGQLKARVKTADLAPELPPEALTDHVEPVVRELARRAIDSDVTPDTPQGGRGPAYLPDADADAFFDFIDTDEIERAEADDAQPGVPKGNTPTVVQPPVAHPGEAVPPPADAAPQAEPEAIRTPTDHPPQSPRPSEDPSPAASQKPPRAALRVAERLREAYAHGGSL